MSEQWVDVYFMWETPDDEDEELDDLRWSEFEEWLKTAPSFIRAKINDSDLF